MNEGRTDEEKIYRTRRTHEMSGQEFLEMLNNDGKSLMGMAERGQPNGWARQRAESLSQARSGAFLAPDLRPHDGHDTLPLETLSLVTNLAHAVNGLARLVEKQNRMIQFLVERVPGAPPEGPK